MRGSWRIRRRTDKSLIDLARMFNPVLRGWIQYYGSFCRSALYPVFRSLDRALRQMGDAQVQATAPPSAPRDPLARTSHAPRSAAICTLAPTSKEGGDWVIGAV